MLAGVGQQFSLWHGLFGGRARSESIEQGETRIDKLVDKVMGEKRGRIYPDWVGYGRMI